MVGDLRQLPLVNDIPPYQRKIQSKLLWEEFKIVITLNHIFKQDRLNSGQERFRLLLTNIRDANPTIDDWILLMTRSYMNRCNDQ